MSKTICKVCKQDAFRGRMPGVCLCGFCLDCIDKHTHYGCEKLAKAKNIAPSKLESSQKGIQQINSSKRTTRLE